MGLLQLPCLSLRTFAGFEKSLFQSARIVLILRHHVRQQEGLLRRRGQRREARQARRLRAGRRGYGHRQEGRILRVPERQDLQEDHRRRLWRVLGPRLRNLYEEENKKRRKNDKTESKKGLL